MPQCSQCERPALYAVGDQQIPMCLHCWALHQSVMERQIGMLERQADRAMDDMEMITGVRLRPVRPPPPAPVIVQGGAFHNINIKDSNVGVVNTGNLHQVDTAVSVIEKAGDKQLASVIKVMTETMLRHPSFTEAQKKEGVEVISALASEATQPKEQRRAGVARPLIARLRELLSVSADLATIAQTAIPILSTAFGL